MWRAAVQQTGTAALYFGLFLSHLVGEGCGAVTVLSPPGRPVSLPCPYRYEAAGEVPQLSVQWRSPSGALLCHYIKHRGFRNCTAGYGVAYRPGSITLSILGVRSGDYGAHVCSVSKRHEFTDYSVELLRAAESVTSASNDGGTQSESVTSAPNDGGTQSGPVWTLVFLHMLGLLVCT